MMDPAWPKRIDFGQLEYHANMAEKRAFQDPKSGRVFGQAPKPAKIFRAGLYARVSTHDNTGRAGR
jgi:hypothetical protein